MNNSINNNSIDNNRIDNNSIDNNKKTLTERFLSYVRINTQSDPSSDTSPSSERQWDLLRMLCRELGEMGIEAQLTEHGYIYAHLPPDPGYENARAVGFVSHVDTSPDFCSEGVEPIIHTCYNAQDITLPSGRVISTGDFPHLSELEGMSIITSDGTTLLGADDKAGVAEIMDALSRIIEEGIPHGRVCVCFTPDEETGRGTEHLDPGLFGAELAYTLDGSRVGDIEYENFNAACADVTVTGKNVHPGSARGVMINALRVAMELDLLLGRDKRPEQTDGYEGFYHLCSLEGDVESARAHYIIREHDIEKLEQMKAHLERGALLLDNRYGAGTVRVEIRDQYRNMAEVIESEENSYVLDIAREAISECGITPASPPIRGGTDGAHISFMGIPCPNLGTGGYCYHGPYEHACIEQMHLASDIILAIVRITAERGKQQ